MVLSSRRAAQTRDDATGMAGSALSVAEVAEGAAPNSFWGAWRLKPDPEKPDVRNFRGGRWKRDYGARASVLPDEKQELFEGARPSGLR